ncbi:tyrosine-type recombinase/integrase [Psittacicella gerlachiana]|uniref:Core-binding (CB) domain-containing protein n=1 Tax=Psittacicella gerlachiana TaxID=2028574 RepID=A0A3A1YGM8_9GAMM|nr:tyrosine-type recombinase/integrase [Psittacicella gerlachiana]RIY36419.1 hypothetical protein CKF59_02800 [Psittacicella gerlachiana]
MNKKITKSKINQALKELRAGKYKREKVLVDGAGLELRLSAHKLGVGSWSWRYFCQQKQKYCRYTFAKFALDQQLLEQGQRFADKPWMTLAQARSHIQHLEFRANLSRFVELSTRIEEILQRVTLLTPHYQKPSLSLRILSQDYLKFYEQHLRKNTLLSLQQSINFFAQMQLLDLPVEQLTNLYLRQSLNALYEQGHLAKIKLVIGHLNLFLKHGVEQELISSFKPLSMKAIFAHSANPKPQASLTLEQVEPFLQALAKFLTPRRAYKVTFILVILLSACRANEVFYFSSQELDLKRKLWLLPAQRMKAKREHQVPLDPLLLRCLRLLEGFQEQKRALRKVLTTKHYYSLDFPQAWTLHGFRALFYTSLISQFPEAEGAISRCLAHKRKYLNPVDSAYDRQDDLKLRRRLYRYWFNLLSSTSVVTLIERLEQIRYNIEKK